MFVKKICKNGKKEFPVGPHILTRPLHPKQQFFKGGLRFDDIQRDCVYDDINHPLEKVFIGVVQMTSENLDQD